MIFLTKAYTFIKNLDTKVIAFAGGALLVIFMMQQCNRIDNLKVELEQTQQRADNNLNNYIASKDSVTYFKSELGNTVAERDAFVFELDDLNKAHKRLGAKYAIQLGINRDLKGVNNLLRADIEIKDSLLAITNVNRLTDSTGNITFKRFDDFGEGNTRKVSGILDYRLIGGNLTTSNANLITSQTMKLRAAILEEDGKNIVRITTDYPGLKISDVENISLINNRINQEPTEPKSGGWSLGMGIGYGINLNPNGNISHGPSIGIGLMWSPKWLRF